MSSDNDLAPIETDVLARVTVARAEYLRRTGDDLHWSTIGREVGWSQTGASHVKTGKRPIRLREIPILAAMLGVRVEWLAFGSGPMIEDSAADSTEAFHAEQARKYPPARHIEAPRKGRKTG